jgi:hypothetical protein
VGSGTGSGSFAGLPSHLAIQPTAPAAFWSPGPPASGPGQLEFCGHLGVHWARQGKNREHEAEDGGIEQVGAAHVTPIGFPTIPGTSPDNRPIRTIVKYGRKLPALNDATVSGRFRAYTIASVPNMARPVGGKSLKSNRLVRRKPGHQCVFTGWRILNAQNLRRRRPASISIFEFS